MGGQYWSIGQAPGRDQVQVLALSGLQVRPRPSWYKGFPGPNSCTSIAPALPFTSLQPLVRESADLFGRKGKSLKP
jgi:hypothetical protein